MFKKIISIIFILSLTVLVRAYSQDSIVLTLQQCIKLGLEKNHIVALNRYKIQFSEEKIKEIKVQQLPILRFTGSYTRLSPIDPFKIGSMEIQPSLLNSYVFRLSLTQPLFTGGRILNSINQTENLYYATEKDFERDKNQLVLDIKTAFWNYYKAVTLLKVIDENINQIKYHLNDLTNLYTKGLATYNDVLKVKVQLANAEFLKLDAQNNIDLARVTLNNLLGIELTSRTTISAELDSVDVKLPTLQELYQLGLKNRSEIQGMEFRIKAAESAINMSRAGWFPQLSFVANYNYANPNTRIFPQENKFKGTWDIGISLTYDLWNWNLNSKLTNEAELQLKQTKTSFAQMKDAILFEINQSYINVTKSIEKVKLTKETIIQAEENYRVTYEKFKSGLVLNSEVVDAEVALLQANINYVSSLVDYYIALSKLEKSIETNIKQRL
ncbi:MAG: TolC family protein [Ignavibacteria bacterium]